MKVNEAETKRLFTTFLNLECGVLLDEDNTEYEVYSQAYDKKHAYYDETYLNGLEKDFEHLKQVGLDYVRNGVNGTYAVLTSIAVQGTEEDEFIANAIDEIKEYDFIEESIDFFDGEQFKAENVIWSAYKDDSGEIHEDFVETEELAEFEDEHEVEVPWGGIEHREMPSDYEKEEESLKEGLSIDDYITVAKQNELTRKYHSYEVARKQLVKEWKEIAKEFPYWVVSTSEAWDPEGLNIPNNNYTIKFAGSEAECKEKINKIHSDAKSDSESQNVEEYKEDEFVTIYYPNAISRSTYYIMKKDESTNESLKEDNGDKDLEAKLPEGFNAQMDWLAADEEEAIEGYDKVLLVLDPKEYANAREQIEKIRDEEVAHKEFLETLKTNKDAIYKAPSEASDVKDAVDLDGDASGKDKKDEKDESLKEGAEGHRVPGKEYVIYDCSLESKKKAPIVAIRSTYTEAQWYCNKPGNFDRDLGIDEVPVGRFEIGDDFYGPFDADWNKIEESKKEKVEYIEMPHEEYTSPEDIKRINDELSEKAKEDKLIGIRREQKLLMFAEPAINGIWTMYLNDDGYIEKIVLF